MNVTSEEKLFENVCATDKQSWTLKQFLNF